MMVTVLLQHCQVSPLPGTVSEKSLPLTFFDLLYLHFFPIQHLFFFEFPLSKDHFQEYVIPTAQHSLSLTLRHFFPLAGKLAFPPNSSKPEIRYKDGDSVTLIFAESSDDFNHLAGNHARNASDFHDLLPQLPPGSMSNDTLLYPLVAIQLTHFANHGISVAFNIHHAVGDGTTIANFIRSWGLMVKSGGQDTVLEGLLPCYDRALFRDLRGLELETIFWNRAKTKKFEEPQPRLPTNKVRATFVMSQASVQQLKKHVTALCPSLPHVSTFTITCGYAWSCMVKVRAASGEEVDKDEEEYFRFQANCRTRLNLPLPTNYFGNCLVACVASAKSSKLLGAEGFVVATKSVGETIHKRLSNEEGVLNGAKNWMSELEALKGKRCFGASSSPRFKVYDMNFGWGSCKKVEMLIIDESGTMALSDCIDGEGDTEIGLSLPKDKMDAFASIFANGLKECQR